MKIGNQVCHVRFGAGKITEFEEGRVSIRFDQSGETRMFSYPEAFERFLTTEDAELKAETEKLLELNVEKKRERVENEELSAVRRCEMIYAQARESKKNKTVSAARKKATAFKQHKG